MTRTSATFSNVHISDRLAAGDVPSPSRSLPFGSFRRFDELTICNGGVIAKRASVPGRMPVGAARGKIYGFSLASRRRLRAKLMRVAWDKMTTYWVTLTYHNEWGVNWRDWKRDLQTFLKRLRRRYPSRLGLFWRLEFQERGAPHYHILLCFPQDGGPDRSMLRSWIRYQWVALVGDLGDTDHVKHGTKVVLADRNKRGKALARLLNYVVKDVGKVDQGLSINRETGEVMPTGRTWGVRGELMQRDDKKVQFLTPEAFDAYVERCKVAHQGTGWFIDALSPEWEGFTLVGDGFGELTDLLEGLAYEDVPVEGVA